MSTKTLNSNITILAPSLRLVSSRCFHFGLARPGGLARTDGRVGVDPLRFGRQRRHWITRGHRDLGPRWMIPGPSIAMCQLMTQHERQSRSEVFDDRLLDDVEVTHGGRVDRSQGTRRPQPLRYALLGSFGAGDCSWMFRDTRTNHTHTR